MLRDACEYALSTGGKRFRPSLVLMIAQALEPKSDARYAALGVELFHTASLVADDLPSMDNDDERRQQPSVHKKYGEGLALLTSYALIAAGYECIVKNSKVLQQSNPLFVSDPAAIGMLALENATFNTGLNGATGGQFLDVAPPDLSMQTLKKIIHMKTSSLFEVAFVFGWLFGGGDINRLEEVKSAASHFGFAFQLADDLSDRQQDLDNGKPINFANTFGVEKTIEMFHVEQSGFLSTIKELGIDSADLRSVACYLESLI